jgi:hypothetical protein
MVYLGVMLQVWWPIDQKSISFAFRVKSGGVILGELKEE